MRERNVQMLDVLTYLFEHYFNDHAKMEAREAHVVTELIEAGFQPSIVEAALDWFEDLKNILEHVDAISDINEQSMRILSLEEEIRLSSEAREYFNRLEQIGILNATLREVVLDRLMALDDPILEIAEVKIVTLLVLYHCPQFQNQLVLMEELVFFENEKVIH